MQPQDRYPQLIAAAVAATGVLFLCAGVFELSFIQTQPPGTYFLIGFAVVFILGGSFFFLRARQGELQPQGESVTEIRMRAIENLESPEMVSRIAQEDPDPTIREKALERLEEMAS